MSVAQKFLDELKKGELTEAIDTIQSSLKESTQKAIEERREEFLKEYGFSDSEENDTILDEATKKETYTDIDDWKDRAKELEPKVKFTEEGHGGSKAIIASVSGNPQMIGKFFLGGESKTKGKGTIYNTEG